MFKELIHHVGIHIAQHPKEAVASAIAAGEVVAPVLVAAAPYVAGAVIIGGAIYVISKL